MICFSVHFLKLKTVHIIVTNDGGRLGLCVPKFIQSHLLNCFHEACLDNWNFYPLDIVTKMNLNNKNIEIIFVCQRKIKKKKERKKYF